MADMECIRRTGGFRLDQEELPGSEGLPMPESFRDLRSDVPVTWMANSNETWGTQSFVPPDDLSHDMHVNIVTFSSPAG